MDQNQPLTPEQVEAFTKDPSLIETHDVALQVIHYLDRDIANIQVQLDQAMLQANVKPLSMEREDWFKRCSYAGAMMKNARHRVMQRDKEIRHIKGPAVTPKRSESELAINAEKQRRLTIEAEDRRAKRLLEIETVRVEQQKLAQQRREFDAMMQQTFFHRFHDVAKRHLPEAHYKYVETKARETRPIDPESRIDLPLETKTEELRG